MSNGNNKKNNIKGMLNMRVKLEARATTIKQEREKMRSLLELAESKKIISKTFKSMEKLDTSGDQEIDSLLDSIFSQIDQEDTRAELVSQLLE